MTKNQKGTIIVLRKQIKIQEKESKDELMKLKNMLDSQRKEMQREFIEKHQTLINENNFLKENLTIDNFALMFCHCIEKYKLLAQEELAIQIYANTLPMFARVLIDRKATNDDTQKLKGQGEKVNNVGEYRKDDDLK